MAVDEKLAEKVRNSLMGLKGMNEKKMFGGLCFLMNGNMVCGVLGDRIIVRTGPEKYEEALNMKHASVFDLTGRKMKGFVYVAPEGVKRKDSLAKWLKMGLDYASTLPKK